MHCRNCKSENLHWTHNSKWYHILMCGDCNHRNHIWRDE